MPSLRTRRNSRNWSRRSRIRSSLSDTRLREAGVVSDPCERKSVVKDIEIVDPQDQVRPGPPERPWWLTRINAPLARYSMYFAVAGLLAIVVVVFYQVFGRYVLNSSPTWAESFALVLILYVTLLGAAVGVRDAGHIGMESLLVLAPEKVRNQIEL